MTKSEIITIQRQLNAAGWSVKIDGVYGPETHDAYQAWLNANTPESMPTPAPAAAKPWFLSRAVIGILVSMAALAANVWGGRLMWKKRPLWLSVQEDFLWPLLGLCGARLLLMALFLPLACVFERR